ncbi:MAG TPA: L-iditol 2-dehydrogenase [Bdellovibrionales bacterium]|nr:MAG: L-iditol 2-dehydrogenase [Bdellovibrionales bacterium GWB1_52_6]OFZ02920.1 MAG: L-iditol 2-dehydrogenase [Bdellovibrionales bacterium GWA1_52_35]OFZ40817.1 MAG: L-iditol 2-dehydrogenase [Bdellovibrionales bacterium GWC1_52_8]HAR42827.1 L-iditol 2-dehydrogenase [Bdellovibrionales bacterium]HCM38503.1 L-iditol 2-dehydrogenase [Bdellovibrionales bacterium]
MKASVLTGPRQMRVENVSLPEPGPGEVRLKLEGCGVCGSNLASWVGMPWTQYPLAPGALGHEGWGRVDAIGSGVTGIKKGDRVSALSDHAFAEYDITRADRVVPLPLDMKDFPGEAVGCAMNIFRRSKISKGQTVAIVGIGFLGAVLTRLAEREGARVIAISRRSFSLEVARKMGAAEVIPMDDHYKIINRVKELTDGLFCDRVIEAIGQQWPLDLSAELTRERGRLMIAGYHQDGPRQINMQLWNWRGLDVVNAHERDPEVYIQGIRDALQAIQTGRIDPTLLYTHRYPLEHLDEALNANLERPEGFLKALVTYD